jgi:F-type H+-transporting ATPase subunit a
MNGPLPAFNLRKALVRAALALFAAFIFQPSFAADDFQKENKEAEAGYNAGRHIIEHIGDSHEWHIVGDVHIPLPVILHVPGGMEFFSSARLSHGASYTGAHGTYALHEGKVVVVNADGSENVEVTSHLLDISLTKNACAIIVSVLLLLWLMIGTARWYARNPNSAPKGLAGFMEPIILFIRDDVSRKSIGDKHYARFTPYLLTLFFFLWINNITALIPIFPFGANITGNIVTPLVLAVITFFIVTIVAKWHYWRHMLAMPGIPVAVLVILTPIEVLSHFIRPTVLMIRLFANLMSGHIVLLVFFSLIFIFGATSVTTGYIVGIPALAFSIFINLLELLVGAIQAYVFTLLTAMYIGAAVADGHHGHDATL